MRIWTSMLLGITLLASPGALPGALALQDGSGQRVTLNFVNSDISMVLNGLARKAHANIIFPQDVKAVVTVRLNDVPIEEAISQVSSQAGLVYRKVGTTYIIAKPATMKETMRNVGTRERVPILNGEPAIIAKDVEKNYPYLTAQTAGRTIELIGAPSDIAEAKALIREEDQLPNAGGEGQPVTRPLSLNYIKADEVAATLSKTYPKLFVQSLGNSKLIISGPSSEVEAAAGLVREIDRGGSVSQTKFTVYHVKYVSAVSLRSSLMQMFSNIQVVTGPDPFRIPEHTINLATGSSLGQATNGSNGQIGGGSSGGNTVAASATPTQTAGTAARTLLLGGSEPNIAAALALLEQIDIAQPQVVLDVKVVSANPETVQSLGVQWSQNVGTTVFERPNLAPANDFPVQLGSAASVKVGDFGIGSFGRLPISFTTQLNAFFTRTDVRVLAKPSITALDDEDGIIFVGETRRVSVSSLVPNTGGSSVVLNSVVEIPVGIILQMHPHVTEGDQIQMRLHPIYSSIDSTPAAAGLFNTFNREAETVVRIKSGETVVIGGLVQEEDTKTFNKVPILGDIPLLGQLFRNTSRDHFRREVLIFVTPHLISD